VIRLLAVMRLRALRNLQFGSAVTLHIGTLVVDTGVGIKGRGGVIRVGVTTGKVSACVSHKCDTGVAISPASARCYRNDGFVRSQVKAPILRDDAPGAAEAFRFAGLIVFKSDARHNPMLVDKARNMIDPAWAIIATMGWVIVLEAWRCWCCMAKKQAAKSSLVSFRNSAIALQNLQAGQNTNTIRFAAGMQIDVCACRLCSISRSRSKHA